jgi:hypothetical protein
MGDAARLPVLAPASVGTPRAVKVSNIERRRHIAVTACAECRAKKRKVGFNEMYPPPSGVDFLSAISVAEKARARHVCRWA